MLVEDIHESTPTSVIDSMPCKVQLPEKLKETFEQRGPTPTMPSDQRHFVRVRCRSLGHRAGMQSLPTYDSLQRDESWQAVYLADFSKEGVQFIHGEQVFPGENVRLFLLTGNLLTVEAVRCRRLGEHCYSVGAKIIKADDPPAE